MVNTLITKNTAKEIANVLFGNTATIVNCTIVGNGTSLSFSTDSNVYNSIILTDVESGGSANAYNTVSTFTDWANKPADEGGDEGDEGDGGGGEGGEGAALPMATGAEGPDDNGNILYQDGDSLFLGEGNDPYSLASDSIAINAGEISYYASYGGEAGNYDIVGMPRIADSIDCGAYEYYETPDIVTNPLYIVVTTESDVVDPTDGEISLREAILYATNGSTITFVDEVVSITLDGNLPQIEINKDLTIVDPDVTITGVSNRRVFAIYGNPDEGNISVSFSGLNITGGAGLSAENVDLELTNVDITGNSLDSGGSGAGIFASNSALTLTDVNITNNRISLSGSGAGIYAKSSALDFNNVKINGNTVIDSNSTVYGAGIFLDSSELIMRGIGSDISGNSLEGYTAYGGAIYSIASIVELSGVKITDNSASADVGSSSAYGGGIYISDTSSLAMNDCTLHGNRLTGYGTYGNALYSENSEVIGSYTTVRDNTASATYSAYGGGFYLSASNVFLTNMQIGCEKQGVYNNYSIKIPGNSLSVSDSSGRVYGGAIYATANSPEAYDLVIHDSLIEGNEGVAGSDFGIGEGGAIWLNNGILRVYNTQISQNSVTAGSTRGGGIYLPMAFNTRPLYRCVQFGKRSPYGRRYSYGGGIFVSRTAATVRKELLRFTYDCGCQLRPLRSKRFGDITETQADLDFGQNNIIDFNPYFLETAFLIVTGPSPIPSRSEPMLR